MANRKFRIGMLVIVLVFGMTLVGCDNGSTGSGNIYYCEAFTVEISKANSITIPTTANYDQLKAVRDQLKNIMEKLLLSQNGLTQADVKETLTMMMPESQANTAISNLNGRGNNLLKGIYATDTSYNVFWYFEKQ